MRLRSWSIVLLAALAQGCAAVQPPPVVEPVKVLPAPLSIRAEASVEVDRPAVALNGRAVVLAKSPGSFRIEVLGPFGLASALLVSDGKTVYLLSGGKSRRYSSGDPGVPYSFKPDEAVSYLTGSVREAAECGCEVSKDAHGRASKVVKSEDGSPVLTVTLADYRAVAGADVPFDIKIAHKKETLRIRYTSVEVNPALEAGFFSTEGLP